MSDWKSKLPNLKEITTMSTKLAKDIKNSVCDIVEEYKKNHPSAPTASTPKPTEAAAQPKEAAPKKPETGSSEEKK